MQHAARRILVTLVAVAVTGVLAGCGSEEPVDTAGSDNEGAFEGAAIEVVAEDFSFSPTTVSLDVSEEALIVLTNEGDTTHSFTSDELAIDIEAASGESGEATVTAPEADATYSFYCRFHPGQMTGKVVVGSGGDATDDTDTGEGVEENDDGIDY